ncbi:MAG: saccharopine dehydrogenase NADP-binding domain-containing protein [Aigarchaeota archaeon]|nr:saccharopine dehydrogenase NADP-binding domain-containing protein [Aigarchaeota archaeon]MCX8193578.1 saccharopine dehydrogenase NADP-binding domain-containing protein [Nitrososphaeria archaeon]MDW7986553.1 saccharopine dehydrogenase C-terminal domain-containing protein [Nitrososphaerota archaeon]
MKFLVLGGSGLIGSTIIRDLLTDEEVEEVEIGDIDEEKSRKLIKDLSDGRVQYKHIDVTDVAGLSEEMKRYDVTINSTWYQYNLHVTKAAISSKSRLIDLGGLYHMTLRQLELDEEARKAGASILIGCGEDPGISNIMIKHIADMFDEVDSIWIRDGDRDLKPLERPIFKFSIRTIVDEWVKNAVIFRDGRFEEVPPLSGIESFDFPEPVGRLMVAYSIHSELATIPRTIKKGLRYVDFKLSENFELVNLLRSLGFLSDDLINIDNLKIAVRELTVKLLSRLMMEPSMEFEDATCILVKVKGVRNGVETVHTMYALSRSRSDWRATASSYITGVPPSIVARMMVRGELEFYGVQPPETCIPTLKFLSILKKYRGITIGEKIEREL